MSVRGGRLTETFLMTLLGLACVLQAGALQSCGTHVGNGSRDDSKDPEVENTKDDEGSSGSGSEDDKTDGAQTAGEPQMSNEGQGQDSYSGTTPWKGFSIALDALFTPCNGFAKQAMESLKLDPTLRFYETTAKSKKKAVELLLVATGFESKGLENEIHFDETKELVSFTESYKVDKFTCGSKSSEDQDDGSVVETAVMKRGDQEIALSWTISADKSAILISALDKSSTEKASTFVLEP